MSHNYSFGTTVLFILIFILLTTIHAAKPHGNFASPRDQLPLATIPLISTHNTASSYMDDNFTTRFIKCQSSTITQQLNCGVKLLVLTAIQIGNEVYMSHGIVPTKITFEQLLNEVITWLSKNPEKTVFAHFRACTGVECYAMVNASLQARGLLQLEYPRCFENFSEVEFHQMDKYKLSSGGSLVVAPPQCVLENYDPTVECYGYFSPTAIEKQQYKTFQDDDDDDDDITTPFQSAPTNKIGNIISSIISNHIAHNVRTSTSPTSNSFVHNLLSFFTQPFQTSQSLEENNQNDNSNYLSHSLLTSNAIEFKSKDYLNFRQTIGINDDLTSTTIENPLIELIARFAYSFKLQNGLQFDAAMKYIKNMGKTQFCQQNQPTTPSDSKIPIICTPQYINVLLKEWTQLSQSATTLLSTQINKMKNITTNSESFITQLSQHITTNVSLFDEEEDDIRNIPIPTQLHKSFNTIATMMYSLQTKATQFEHDLHSLIHSSTLLPTQTTSIRTTNSQLLDEETTPLINIHNAKLEIEAYKLRQEQLQLYHKEHHQSQFTPFQSRLNQPHNNNPFEESLESMESNDDRLLFICYGDYQVYPYHKLAAYINEYTGDSYYPYDSQYLETLQIHWQYSTTSILIGTLLDSSIVKDQQKTNINDKFQLKLMNMTKPENIRVVQLDDVCSVKGKDGLYDVERYNAFWDRKL